MPFLIVWAILLIVAIVVLKRPVFKQQHPLFQSTIYSLLIHLLIPLLLLGAAIGFLLLSGLLGCNREGDPFSTTYCPFQPKIIEQTFQSIDVLEFTLFLGGFVVIYSHPWIPVLTLIITSYCIYLYRQRRRSKTPR